MPDLPRVSVAGGSVAPGQLGRTLLHEHLVVTSPEVWASWTALLGSRAALVDRAAAELAEIKAEHGIDTIVDVSTPDMGRNSDFIEEVSARSGVAVVVATGSWLRPPRSYLERDDEQLARYFVAEIEDGIEGGPSRAGVIKVASGRHLDDSATKIFRAAALAHQATGVPIIAHGEAGPASIRCWPICLSPSGSARGWSAWLTCTTPTTTATSPTWPNAATGWGSTVFLARSAAERARPSGSGRSNGWLPTATPRSCASRTTGARGRR